MVHVFGSTRLQLTWGCGCVMPSQPWRTMLCSWYLPWWNVQQRKKNSHGHTQTYRHAFNCAFLKFPLGVSFLLHFFEPQRNWRPVSWLHSHAESSANQVEPLDSEVTFLKRNLWHIITASYSTMCDSCHCPASLSLSTWLVRPSVTLLLWAEMWIGFKRSRKESTFYLLAGTLQAHTILQWCSLTDMIIS